MSLENLLTQTCQVQKLTTSASALGGVVNTWTDRIASISCLFNQRRSSIGTESIEFGKMTNRDDNILYLPYSASAVSIAVSDRVIIDSKTYEVTTQPYNVGNRNKLVQVNLEEVEI